MIVRWLPRRVTPVRKRRHLALQMYKLWAPPEAALRDKPDWYKRGKYCDDSSRTL